MRVNRLTTGLMLILAVLLIANLLRPGTMQPITHAQSSPVSVYVEPGVYMMRAPDGSRQQLGKVIVDLNTGNVWAFPTATENPYPVDVTSQSPPVSKPFLLGKFDLSAMSK